MTQISVNEAARQLDRLVRLAHEGEEIVLTEADQPTARLVSIGPAAPTVAQRKKRCAGSGKGIFTTSPDFDTPLHDFSEYME